MYPLSFRILNQSVKKGLTLFTATRKLLFSNQSLIDYTKQKNEKVIKSRSQVQQKVKIKEQILFVCQQLHYDDKIQMKHNYYIIIHTLMI